MINIESLYISMAPYSVFIFCSDKKVMKTFIQTANISRESNARYLLSWSDRNIGSISNTRVIINKVLSFNNTLFNY
ncbi:MAG: hypothetical protein R6U11_09705 [Bacteroidales bacterium]